MAKSPLGEAIRGFGLVAANKNLSGELGLPARRGGGSLLHRGRFGKKKRDTSCPNMAKLEELI